MPQSSNRSICNAGCHITTERRPRLREAVAYAGCEQAIFSDGATDDMYCYASGSVRLINKAATYSLIYGTQIGRRIIDDHMVKQVIEGELA